MSVRLGSTPNEIRSETNCVVDQALGEVEAVLAGVIGRLADRACDPCELLLTTAPATFAAALAAAAAPGSFAAASAALGWLLGGERFGRDGAPGRGAEAFRGFLASRREAVVLGVVGEDLIGQLGRDVGIREAPLLVGAARAVLTRGIVGDPHPGGFRHAPAAPVKSS